MSETIVEGRPWGGLIVIAIILLFSTALVYQHEKAEALKSEVIEAADLPETAYVEWVHTLKQPTNSGWMKVEVWYTVPNYICSEYELDNEPWKCENIGSKSGAVTFWYNKNTKEKRI